MHQSLLMHLAILAVTENATAKVAVIAKIETQKRPEILAKISASP
jgi:hypothetical protein